MRRALVLLFSLVVLGMSGPLSASSLYVSNNQLTVSTNAQVVSLVLSNVINPTDAGINWIKIVKPSNFDWNVGAIHTNVGIRTYWNGSQITNLSTTNFDTNWGFVSNRAMVFVTNTNELVIMLGNQVTNNANPNFEHIWIDLTLFVSNQFTTASFTAWVDALQVDWMPAAKKNRFATGEPQKSLTSPTVTAKQGQADGQAAIIPNQINQGVWPFTFTFYIASKTNANLDAIRYAAIRVPAEFSNLSLLTNFDSVLLGTNEAATIKITNALPGLTNGGLSNYIYIDYTSAPMSAGGLDVLSFKYYGDPSLGTNLVWQTLVDYNPISTNSLIASTSPNFPSQLLTIGPPNLISSWDYQMVSAINIAPVVVGISNIYPMTYFDIIADGESTDETLTNVTVQVLGAGTNAMGEIRIYRELTNQNSFALTNDQYLTNAYFSGAASVYNLKLAESNQSLSNSAPTRYWVALRITNNTAALFTNTIALRVTNVMVKGTNGGIVDSIVALANPGNQTSRIDQLQVWADASTLTNTNAVVRVKQGSFDNISMKITISNSDPDATNYLSGMAITNEGTAGLQDLGFFKVFLDNGDGVFNAADDLVFAGAMDSNQCYRLSIAVPNTLTGTATKTFWGTYDVKYSGRVGQTVRLKLLSGTNFVWNDTYNSSDFSADQSDPRPVVLGSAVVPTSNATQVITPSSAQAFDFTLSSGSYLPLPTSFTTNQLVPVASFGLAMDTENTNGSDYSNVSLSAQVFRGVQVQLASSNALNGVSGFAYLYRDADTNGVLGAADTLVASNAVTAGAGFTISNFFISNLAINFLQNPDTFFLAFRLTNDINLAKTNTVIFKITNLLGSGPDGGLFANLDEVTNKESIQARVDSPEVVINYISNLIIPSSAPQTSVKNKYLKISVRGNDPDAVHAFSYLDVKTNGLTTVNVAADHINQVALENSVGDFLGLGKITNGSLRISLYTPEVLSGTNEYIYYLTYNVTILAAVGSNIGFTITNGSFGFSDPISDGFAQSSFASGATSGPTLQSNATIVAFNYTPWDFNVIANANTAPPSIGVSNLYLMSYFDLRADEESPANEILTNVGVRLFGVAPNLSGEIRLYRDTNDMTTFVPTSDRLVTNAWFTNNQTSVNLNFTGENNLNTLSSTPDQHNRFYLALRLTNGQSAVFTNTIGLYATNLAGVYGSGPAVFTNFSVLTNVTAQTSRVDSFQISAYVQSNNGQDVKQGSFNNLVFKMVFTNFDVDATNYFSGLVVSNAGNSSNADLGFFRLYRDTGSGAFESTNDTLVMLGSMNANRQFVLSANPAIVTGPGETIFWGTIDVDLAAVTNRRISLLIPQISNNITFSDVITESSFASYDQRPTLATTGPYPSVLNSNNILNFNSQPFDFYVQNVSYASKPVSFTTNQRAPLGQIDLYRDVDVNPVVLTDVDVAVLSSGSKNAVSGFAYLYKETNGNAQFDTGDQILASNAVTTGAGFSFALAYSNASLNDTSPDRLYVVFQLTNALSNAMTNRFAFQITNLRGIGQDGAAGSALFTNSALLTNVPSGDTRIDSYRIAILTLTNFLDTTSPKQYDQNHSYLQMRLAGEDPDGTNYFSYLDVVTNGLAQISNDTIALVKLYTNTNAGGSLGSPVASAVFDTASARLALGSPIALAGTNVLTLFVGYDVGASSNVIGKKLGLLITNGGIGFTDVLADNFSQDAYASGLTSGPVPATNVQIYSFNSQPWDFTVIQSRNLAPVSIGVSNLYVMSYFDVMQDQESPDTQFLTNVEVLIQGTAPNVNGELRLYRDIGDLTAFDTNSDTLIATLPFSSSAGSQQITFSNGLLALYGIAIDPTRYYVSLRITNTANAVFSNNVRLVVTNIRGIGPNGGLVQNGNLLYAVTNQVARVDDLKVFAFGDTNNLAFINQGSIDNFAFKLVLSNADPDATNYLSSLIVSNAGTAGTNDLSIFKLYADNGDGIFDKASDPLLANAGLSSNFQYALSLIPYALGPGSNVFWGSYDVSLNATTNRSVLLRVVPGSLGFSDQFADSSFATYDQRPVLQNAGTFPATNTTSRITFANVQNYDFIVNAASYSLPASFTTNQLVNVGYVDLYQDLDIDPLALSNAQVRVTGVSANALGMAFLYRTIAGSAFSTNELVGSIGVNGASFTIPISTSNLAVKTPTPPLATRFYLAYLLTNDIDLAKTNTIAFQITNFSVYRNGQSGILSDPSALLSGTSSILAHVDNPKVNILYITNDFVFANNDYSPQNSGRNNAYLHIRLSGDDIDATNYLSALDVVTNALSDMSSNLITQVKIYTNKGAYDPIVGYFNEADLIGSAGFPTGAARIYFGLNRLQIVSTNAYDLYLAYTVGVSSLNVGKKIGLAITNGSFTFDDPIADGFAQGAFASGATSGPVPATNAVVVTSSSQPWDFSLIQSKNVAPIAIGISNLYLMSYFDLMQDQENPLAQMFTNLQFAFDGSAAAVNGEVRLYRDAGDLVTFDTNTDALAATTAFSSSAGLLNMPLSQSNIAIWGQVTDPTRYWVALRITNAANAVYTNRFRLVVTNLQATGPNAGLIQNLSNIYIVSGQMANVDNLRSFATAATNGVAFVKQGSIDNYAFKLILTNGDPDQTNYLSGITATNLGTAGTNDLGILKFYADNGDGLFDKNTDTLWGSANLNANSQYVLSFPPYAMPVGSNLFFGSYDVFLGAATNKTAVIQLNANGLVFSDQYAESSFASYDQRPVLTSVGPYPSANSTNRITFADAQNYDFIVNAASYSLPASFTTNQLVNVGYVDLYQDLDVEPLGISNAQVRVTGLSANALGLAYLYRTVAGSAFSTNELVGSNVVNGASFTIPISTSNLALKTPTPPAATRFYLAFKLTNDINLAKTNTIAFQITNFTVWHNGQAGVLSDPSSIMSGTSSTLANIDSPKINIFAITNDLVFANGDYSPKNNGRNNAYLYVSIGGDDPDATNYLSSLDIVTNALSDVGSNLITTVRVYSNKGVYDAVNGYFSETDLLGSQGFNNGLAHISFGANRLTLVGTNRYGLYVAFTVGSSALNVGKKIGLAITNGSFTFDDPLPSDGFPQGAFASGVTSGPALVTNAVVLSSAVQPWDVDIVSIQSAAPTRTLANIEIPVLVMDIYRDTESGSETISNIVLASLLNTKAFRGNVSVYYQNNSTGYTDFRTGTLLASNYSISHTNSSVSLALTNPSLPALPTFGRFYVTYTPIDFALDAVNVFQITNILAAGPNGGTINSLLPLTATSTNSLDDNTVNAVVETIMPSTLKQGTENTAAFKITLTPRDTDASFSLERLTFSISNNSSDDQFLKGTLYRESGDATGFDDKDTPVSGSVTFSKGTARINLNSAITLTSTGGTFYLVVGVTSSATPGTKVKIYFPRELQIDSFTAYNILGVSYPTTLGTYSINQTQEFEILRWLEFGDEEVKIASTVINTCEGNPMRIYVKDSSALAKLRVYVFDMLGYKIRELTVKGDVVEWRGENTAGTVPSGMYQIIVQGEKISKKFRVMVKQCQ